MFYYRQYPTQEVQGFFFGMSQAQANEWVHRLSGILKQALGDELQLPERRPARLEAVLSTCPSLELMIDGTEWPINRPKDKEKQKTYYSGKKKAHTVKNNLIVERGSKLLQDTGYEGYRPEGVMIVQPKKKPWGGKLTDAEKVINRAISSLRVEVKHQIGGVKRAQIVVQKFRNLVGNFVDEVMETACGLHNFRLAHRR